MSENYERLATLIDSISYEFKEGHSIVELYNACINKKLSELPRNGLIYPDTKEKIEYVKTEFYKLNITETDNALHEMTEKYNLKTDRQVADKIRQLCDSDDPQKKLFNNLSGIINTFYPDTVTDEQSLLLFIFDLIKQSYKPEATDKNNHACLLTKNIISDNTEV